MASGGGIQQMPDELTGAVFTALMWQLLEDNINNGIVTQLGARVTNSGNITCTSTVEKVLQFDTDLSDTDGMHSTTSNTSQIVMNYDGWHQVKACAQWDTTYSDGVRRLRLRVNGSSIIGFDEADPSSGGAAANNVSADRWFTAGDYVEVLGYQNGNSGSGSLAILAANEYSPIFSVVRI